MRDKSPIRMFDLNNDDDIIGHAYFTKEKSDKYWKARMWLKPKRTIRLSRIFHWGRLVLNLWGLSILGLQPYLTILQLQTCHIFSKIRLIMGIIWCNLGAFRISRRRMKRYTNSSSSKTRISSCILNQGRIPTKESQSTVTPWMSSNIFWHPSIQERTATISISTPRD